jgi:hypothetical protein
MFLNKVEADMVKIKKKEMPIQNWRLEATSTRAMPEDMTREEIIAANKARVAKFHPEPDFSTISPQYKKALSKLEHEKSMKERAKKLWCSIVSIPMGGMKKR